MSNTGSGGKVNGTIMDSVAATNATVIGSAPNVALSMFYQAAGQAYGLTMQNAASNQQNVNAFNPTLVSNAVGNLSK